MTQVVDRGGLTVRSAPMHHGMMPAVAYRLDFAGRSIAFTGDIAGREPLLAALAAGCDVLVHDQALPSRDLEHGHLHPPPEDTAANAAEAGCRLLLLSHLMPPIEPELDAVVQRIRGRYEGQVVVASDLLTVTVDGDVLPAPGS